MRLTPGKLAPRASKPGPCRSSSMRISGTKYPTCGPSTPMGWPVAEWEAETSSQFDACGRVSRAPAAADAARGRLRWLGRAHPRAAALAEDPSDQRRLRDHVGGRPVCRCLPDCRVFRGQLGRIQQRLIDVGIDAVDERAGPIDE